MGIDPVLAEILHVDALEPALDIVDDHLKLLHMSNEYSTNNRAVNHFFMWHHNMFMTIT